MSDDTSLSGLELHSEVTSSGELILSLTRIDVGEPGDDEVVVRVEASPLNPSDLGILLAAAELSTAKTTGTGNEIVVRATIPAAKLGGFAGRFDQPLPVGNEGAGTVVRAGRNVEALLGKRVAMQGGGMYVQYRTLDAAQCLPLPDGVTPKDGASVFINPMTALGMVETLRREGHSALVHTAAASNLGQMLVRLCEKDGIGLVNIVRSAEQAQILRELGARHICDSSLESFDADLIEAVAETGATLTFDAIGGGELAGRILVAMETALRRKPGAYNRYGSQVHKQVYVYGGLDLRPTIVDRSIGMAWGIGGWLVMWFLEKIGPEATQRLQARVLSELKTTFESRYTAEISLTDALRPDVMAAYNRRATGEKYLINPALDAA
jgi:NADPH:quinone reductase